MDRLSNTVEQLGAFLREGFQENKDDFAELKELTRSQAETARIQAASVAQLITLLSQQQGN